MNDRLADSERLSVTAKLGHMMGKAKILEMR
jgi:hypothetical protein